MVNLDILRTLEWEGVFSELDKHSDNNPAYNWMRRDELDPLGMLKELARCLVTEFDSSGHYIGKEDMFTLCMVKMAESIVEKYNVEI